MEMNGVEEDTTTWDINLTNSDTIRDINLTNSDIVRDFNLTNSDTVTSLPEFVWTEVQYNTTSTTTKVRVHNNNNK